MTSYERNEPLHITVLGGGGGGSVMAGGLVEAMPDADISVIVATGDSGSKTGELREMFGGPAVGDVRKVMAAVAGNREAGDLFGRRFNENDALYDYSVPFYENLVANGKDAAALSKALERTDELVIELQDRGKTLKGHTFGNLLLTAMSRDNDGDIMPGVSAASEWLDARAKVIPVSNKPHNVVMYDKAAGKIIKGEGVIDEYTPKDASQIEMWLEASPFVDNRVIEDPAEVEEALALREMTPRPRATRLAIGALAIADVGLLAPGSLPSLQPVLQQRGIPEALQAQRTHNGLWVMVANLIEEKPGLTFDAQFRAIQESGRRALTHVIHNTDAEGLPEGTVPLHFNPEDFDLGDAKAIGGALVDSHLVESDPNDPIAHLRSPGHHNAWRVAEVLSSIVKAA